MELRQVCGRLGSGKFPWLNRADPEIGGGYPGKVEFREVFKHHGWLNSDHIRLT